MGFIKLVRCGSGSTLDSSGDLGSTVLGWTCAELPPGRMERFATLEGEVFCGDGPVVTAWMSSRCGRTRAWILLSRDGEGVEAFLRQLPPEVKSIPMAGGASARPGGESEGWLCPGGGGMAVASIQEGQWRSRFVGLHEASGPPFRAMGEDRRSLAVVEDLTTGQQVPLKRWRELFALADIDEAAGWETVALQEQGGRVLHPDYQSELLHLGADLADSRIFRLARFKPERGVRELLSALSPRSLLFACAGLAALVKDQRPWEARVSSTYLFGEVVCLGEEQPAFANLSFSLLQRLD